MIQKNMFPVSVHAQQRAALQAIADVERKRARGGDLPEYPYAHAYFHHLRGSKCISIKEFRLFAPVLTDRELRGNKTAWLQAIDTLIESRGICCWLPLQERVGRSSFPDVAFQRHQNEWLATKYSCQHRRVESQKERAYQARLAQAEIELAFNTPETVSSWSARWTGTELRQYDLEDMFWRWSARFPSLALMKVDNTQQANTSGGETILAKKSLRVPPCVLLRLEITAIFSIKR